MSAVCVGQQTSVVAKRVEAKDSLKIADRWIKLANNDTTPLDGQTRDVMTSNAVYDFVTGRTLQLWQGLSDTAFAIRQAAAAPSCVNKTTSDWSVSWQGVGFNYSVHGGLTAGQGTYQILCVSYLGDSATITFDAADPDQDRIDIIYLDATGVHKREGSLSAPGTAVRPTVDAEEILLTEVLIAAGTTTPSTLTQLLVYNENLGEATVSNTGTTTNADNTTFPYVDTKSVNVTNLTHNDQIFFTKLPDLSTWNVLGYDALSVAVRLKATMPTNANLGVALQVGTTTVGVEVIVPLVKTNVSSYQQISIPIASFGNIGNTNITRVRFRYIRPASGTNYTGLYLDYIYFVDGVITTGGGGGTATFTLNPMVGFSATPTATQQSPGTWTLTPTGYSSLDNFLSPDGWQSLPEILSAIGTLDGRAKSADGAVVDEEEIFLQTVDATYPGLMTSAMFSKLDSNYYIANYGDGDTLALPDPISANITRIKSLIAGTNVTFTVTDSTITINSSGGGGGGRFGVSGEDDAAAEPRNFDLEGNNFSILSQAAVIGTITIGTDNTGDGGDDLQFLEFTDNQNLKLGGSYLTGLQQISFNTTSTTLTSGTNKFVFDTVLEFSDNAAAITGGLSAGMIYRTGDALKIVH